MAVTAHYTTQFQEGCFYHVYNRSVDRKQMFRNEGNFYFFLKRYNDYLSKVVDTYAYCLLGNHFHLLIKIKDLEAYRVLEKVKEGATTHEIISHQFRKFFQSYAMAFNKQHNRIGTLFQTPFKRALVDNDAYFRQLVYYIHANQQLHGLVDDFREWQWSSYYSFLTDQPTVLKRKEVLDFFGGKSEFVNFHLKKSMLWDNEELYIEDEG